MDTCVAGDARMCPESNMIVCGRECP
jgi:hypothetical protein